MTGTVDRADVAEVLTPAASLQCPYFIHIGVVKSMHRAKTRAMNGTMSRTSKNSDSDADSVDLNRTIPLGFSDADVVTRMFLLGRGLGPDSTHSSTRRGQAAVGAVFMASTENTTFELVAAQGAGPLQVSGPACGSVREQGLVRVSPGSANPVDTSESVSESVS